MRILSWLAGAAISLTSLNGAQAATVTIDFDTTATSFEDITSSPFIEDGFVVDGSETTIGRVGIGQLREGAFKSDEFFVLSRQDGGTFTVEALDIGGRQGLPSGGFQLLGILNGIQVVDFGSFLGETTLRTLSLGSQIAIDQFRIAGTGQGGINTPVFDNFVFNIIDADPIPLPAAAWLFGAGLASAAAARRRARVLGNCDLGSGS